MSSPGEANGAADGKVAVVTGCAGGLGLGLASALAARGMSVVMADIDDDALGPAAEELTASGADVLAVPTDVTKEEAVATLAARTLDHYGRVDMVCLNAGVTVGGRAWELSDADWRWVYDVNVFGVVHGLRSFVPALVDRGEGVVLITASNSSVTTIPNLAPYVSSKHAVLAISEVLQHDLLEVAPGVQVSVVLPSAIRSRMAESARHRPAEYGRVEIAEESVAAARAYLEHFGTDPRVMADVILRRVDDGAFCIFTEASDTANVTTRAEALTEGRLVPNGFRGLDG